MTEHKFISARTLVLGGFLLLFMIVTYVMARPSPPPQELLGILRPEFRQLHPFELTGNYGLLVNEDSFRGQWSFVFFGYMSCPDVCPTTLQVLDRVQSLLENESGEDSADIQVYFISVDPGRDNIEALTQYVTHFNEGFVGATADKDRIDSFSRQFGAGYLFEEGSAADQYLVAHTSAIFLVDPSARLVASIPQPHYPAAVASQYQKIRDYIAGGA